MLISKSKMEKTNEETWSKNRLQRAALPGAVDKRRDQKHTMATAGHRDPPTRWRKGFLGMMHSGEASGKTLPQKTLTAK